jgi:hypothetical protein
LFSQDQAVISRVPDGKAWLWALTAGLLLVALCAPAHACEMRWDPVTQYTDASPIPAEVGLTYHLFFQADGAPTAELIAITTETTLVRLCPAGKYWITAHVEGEGNSAPSPSGVIVGATGTDATFKRGQP